MKMTLPIIFITVATGSAIYIRNYYRRREIEEIYNKLRQMILRYNGPDPYGRDMDNKAIYKMAELAHDNLNVNSELLITDGLFNEIYIAYINYKIDESKKILEN